MKNYLDLLRSVTYNGEVRPSRIGETISVFGQSIDILMSYGTFPLLTTRQVYPRGVLGELAAFLQGAEDLQTFKDFGCNYWDHNAAQWHFNEGLEPKDQQVGRIYGAQWRNFGGVDQLAELISGIKIDPYGRRHILSTWNPSELYMMCLPPCHILAQFYVGTDGTLSCQVYMRSVDLCLGLPSDIILYAALLLLVAQDTDYLPGTLRFVFGDTHIYTAHIDSLRQQLSREPGRLPKYALAPKASVFNFHPDMLTFPDYTPQEAIKYELF